MCSAIIRRSAHQLAVISGNVRRGSTGHQTYRMMLARQGEAVRGISEARMSIGGGRGRRPSQQTAHGDGGDLLPMPRSRSIIQPRQRCQAQTHTHALTNLITPTLCGLCQLLLRSYYSSTTVSVDWSLMVTVNQATLNDAVFVDFHIRWCVVGQGGARRTWSVWPRQHRTCDRSVCCCCCWFASWLLLLRDGGGTR